MSSSPSCCRPRRKPRPFSSMSPACACWLFSVVRSKLRNSSRISPRMADRRASCSWALHTIRHTASVRCPAGMELRMCHASRCWGDVREKERLSRRLPAIADTPRHLPHKALISFSVQGYVIQDKRAAQAVCGRKVALAEPRCADREYGGHVWVVQAALCDCREQVSGVLACLGVDSRPDPLVHPAGAAPQGAFDLSGSHGQPK